MNTPLRVRGSLPPPIQDKAMAKAYVIAELVVNDQAAYEAYRKEVLPNVQSYDGQFLVRGGTRIQCEGIDDAHHDQMRTVILEFPSLHRAREWYSSAAYSELKLLRQAASEGRLFIVEGV
jgi:uncharacterized protein (DUF1330 family)